jgi:hypothetical protein
VLNISCEQLHATEIYGVQLPDLTGMSPTLAFPGVFGVTSKGYPLLGTMRKGCVLQIVLVRHCQ